MAAVMPAEREDAMEKLGSNAPAFASRDPSDLLLHKGGIKFRGMKIVFTSKLTTLADKSLGFLDRTIFRKQMQVAGARVARKMIRDLGIGDSKHPALKSMVENTLANIRENKAASRTEFDRLMLLSILNKPEAAPDELICEPSAVEKYAQLRAGACLKDLLSSPAYTREHVKALLDYATEGKAMIARIKPTEDPAGLYDTLKVALMALGEATSRLPDHDPVKLALTDLWNKLLGDMPHFHPRTLQTQQ